MPNNTRDILDIISNYSTYEVVELLQKNNLHECCEAIVKRQVNGATLLHLKERDLNQWKLDLTKPLRRSLYQFVVELNHNPGQYLEEENGPLSPSSDSGALGYESDSSDHTWPTDWEEDEEASQPLNKDSSDSEDSDDSPKMYTGGNSRLRSIPGPVNSWKGASISKVQAEENENVYANKDEINHWKKNSNDNGAQNGHRFEALEKKLKEHLEQGQKSNLVKQVPTPHPKPDPGPKPMIATRPTLPRPPQKPTLDSTPHTVPKTHHPVGVRVNGTYPILPKPPTKRLDIGNDDDSDSDESTSWAISRSDPKYSLSQPEYLAPRTLPSQTRRFREARPSGTSTTGIGRQLLGGLGSRLADEVADMIVRIKRGLLRCCNTQSSEFPEPLEPPEPPGDWKRSVSLNTAARRQAGLSECLTQATLTQARENLAKRSPEKNGSHTFPYTKRDGHLSDGVRAVRPLPQTPSDGSSYAEQPWFHNIGRNEAIALVTAGNSKFSTTPPNGYFLVRPSYTKADQPWTLVLWYKTKVYNIPMRQRPDSRFALGTVKQKEQSFATMEDLINFCKKEEIPLTTNTGQQVGSTRLTESPPRRND